MNLFVTGESVDSADVVKISLNYAMLLSSLYRKKTLADSIIPRAVCSVRLSIIFETPFCFILCFLDVLMYDLWVKLCLFLFLSRLRSKSETYVLLLRRRRCHRRRRRRRKLFCV